MIETIKVADKFLACFNAIVLPSSTPSLQEQQQKQLELILAIGKVGRFLDTKQISSEGSSATNNPISVKKELELETQSERHLG